MAKKAYEVKIGLNHDEKAVIVNTATGEMSYVKNTKNNIPPGKEVFEPKAFFKKDYTKSWQFLRDNLSNIEFAAAFSLALKAKANTNSLQPIGDETTFAELTEVLGVSINVVNRVVKKLFKLGVYGRFEVQDKNKPYTKFWVLNPYLSFSGKLINSDIAELFRGTEIAIHFHSRDNIN